MSDIIRIILVLLTILVFIRLKWNIGYVMLVASGVLFFLYGTPFAVIFATLKATITDVSTLKLFLALTLIRVLELILREQQVMARMMESAKALLRQRKAVIVSMPMLIGLLPSLGGAYFSAPMVKESTADLHMPPEEKAFINYWFRHPWEFILPLYPGILLAAALTTMDLRSLIAANLPFALLVPATGFILSMRGVSGSDKHPGERRKDLRSFLPVGAVLFLVMAFRVELHTALAATIAALFAVYRFSPGQIFRAVRHGFTPDVISLILGVMTFKFAMEGSGAVGHLNRFFMEQGISLLPVLFVLPFVTGLLTGLTVGFVGSTFPLIVSLAGGPHIRELAFAFAAGFSGVLLSPVHLCLVLTREYFHADLWGIYRRVFPATGFILAAAVIEYFVL